jgi:hypothetical protein
MGFCYEGKKLVCDICSAVGGVRKIKCPSGYCQAVAQCPECRKTKRLKREHPDYHQYCAARSAAYKAEQEYRAAVIESGQPVRCSALSVGENKVHVLFQTKGGGTLGYYMTSETYNALPMLRTYTPSDYRKFGELTEAPANYYG